MSESAGAYSLQASQLERAYSEIVKPRVSRWLNVGDKCGFVYRVKAPVSHLSEKQCES